MFNFHWIERINLKSTCIGVDLAKIKTPKLTDLHPFFLPDRTLIACSAIFERIQQLHSFKTASCMTLLSIDIWLAVKIFGCTQRMDIRFLGKSSYLKNIL